MHAPTDMVSQLMCQPVIAVGLGARVDEVMSLAQRNGVHHIPIVERGKLLGLVCTCDMNGAPPGLRALQLARRNVVTVAPDCSAVDAARLMVTEAVGSLVVANRDGLWGIVTRKDLADAHADLAELLASERCAACAAAEHLRPGPGETKLCSACAERASSKHWFDEGSGD